MPWLKRVEDKGHDLVPPVRDTVKSFYVSPFLLDPRFCCLFKLKIAAIYCVL